jgi:hypothetical protein
MGASKQTVDWIRGVRRYIKGAQASFVVLPDQSKQNAFGANETGVSQIRIDTLGGKEGMLYPPHAWRILQRTWKRVSQEYCVHKPLQYTYDCKAHPTVVHPTHNESLLVCVTSHTQHSVYDPPSVLCKLGELWTAFQTCTTGGSMIVHMHTRSTPSTPGVFWYMYDASSIDQLLWYILAQLSTCFETTNVFCPMSRIEACGHACWVATQKKPMSPHNAAACSWLEWIYTQYQVFLSHMVYHIKVESGVTESNMDRTLRDLHQLTRTFQPDVIHGSDSMRVLSETNQFLANTRMYGRTSLDDSGFRITRLPMNADARAYLQKQARAWFAAYIAPDIAAPLCDLLRSHSEHIWKETVDVPPGLTHLVFSFPHVFARMWLGRAKIHGTTCCLYPLGESICYQRTLSVPVSKPWWGWVAWNGTRVSDAFKDCINSCLFAVWELNSHVEETFAYGISHEHMQECLQCICRKFP